MFLEEKRRESYSCKVKDIIRELKKENPEADFYCCGDNHVVIHVEKDNSVVSIDTELLNDPDIYPDSDESKIAQIVTGEEGEIKDDQELIEVSSAIIDTMKNWLLEKGITNESIPNEEREDENSALIYGTDYGYLEEKFKNILKGEN